MFFFLVPVFVICFRTCFLSSFVVFVIFCFVTCFSFLRCSSHFGWMGLVFVCMCVPWFLMVGACQCVWVCWASSSCGCGCLCLCLCLWVRLALVMLCVSSGSFIVFRVFSWFVLVGFLISSFFMIFPHCGTLPSRVGFDVWARVVLVV